MSEAPPREVEVIHQLRNHISVMLAFCDLLLEDTPADDVRRRDLLEIQKAAVAALGLMPQLETRLR